MSTAALTHDVKAAPLVRSGPKPLPINRPGDIYEQEAERVSRDVVNGTSARPAWSLSKIGIAGPLQRECSCGGSCDECKKKKKPGQILQRDAAGEASSTTAPPVVHDVLRGAGNPLDQTTRSLMESRFGHDFSGVRIFNDDAAIGSARAVSANAYTVGDKIVFNQGQYAPQSPNGQRLLAHELAHVVQQGSAQGSEATYEESEREAERAAQDSAGSAVLGRRPVGMARAPGDPPVAPPVAAPAAGGPGKKDMTKEHSYTETVDDAKGLKYKIAEGELGKPGTVENQRSDYQQGKRSTGTGDDAGHLIADLYGGAGGQENLSLQNWKANRFGTYKKMENAFGKKLSQGYKIRVKVTDTTRVGEDRPFMRKVESTETAPDGTVSTGAQLFANTHTPESRTKQGIPATTDGNQSDNLIHVNFKKKKRATTDDEIAEASKPLGKQKKPRTPKPVEAPQAVDAPKAIDVPEVSVPATDESAVAGALKGATEEGGAPIEVPKVTAPKTGGMAPMEEGAVGARSLGATIGGIALEIVIELAIGLAIGLILDWLKQKAEQAALERDIRKLSPQIEARLKQQEQKILQLQQKGKVYTRITFNILRRIGSASPPEAQGNVLTYDNYDSVTLGDVEVVGEDKGSSHTETEEEWLKTPWQSETKHHDFETVTTLLDDPQKRLREKQDAQARETLRKEAARHPGPTPPPMQKSVPLLAGPGPKDQDPNVDFLPGSPGVSPIRAAESLVGKYKALAIALVARGNKLLSSSPSDADIASFKHDEEIWRAAATLTKNHYIKEGPDVGATGMDEVLNSDQYGGQLTQIRNNFGG